MSLCDNIPPKMSSLEVKPCFSICSFYVLLFCQKKLGFVKFNPVLIPFFQTGQRNVI